MYSLSIINGIRTSSGSCRINEYITCKKFLTFDFETLLSHFAQISAALLQYSWSKFTPTKHEFDWNNICKNDSFTAGTRFNEYIEEKVTNSIKPLHVHMSSCVPTWVRSTEPGKKKLRALEITSLLLFFISCHRKKTNNQMQENCCVFVRIPPNLPIDQCNSTVSHPTFPSGHCISYGMV